MRMPRFRIRTLMIAVGVVALMAAGGIESRRLYRLSSYYRSQAATAKRAQMYRTSECVRWEMRVKERQAWVDRSHGEVGPDSFVRRAIAIRDKVSRQVDYWKNLKSKYERAARYPWIPVEPDPPEPAVE